MKIFIRSNDLASGNPEIVAYYDDNSDVPPDAHGEGMTVLIVPRIATAPPHHDQPLRLADDWRERVGPKLMEAEAKRRIDEVFTLEERIAALEELQEALLNHGADIENWPAEAKSRKADLEHKWNYVREIRERVRAAKSVPMNPTSDKIWPTRIK